MLADSSLPCWPEASLARSPELPKETVYAFLWILYLCGNSGSIPVYFTVVHQKKNTQSHNLSHNLEEKKQEETQVNQIKTQHL